MSEELEKQLKILIGGYANNNPAPKRVKIKKIYDGRKFVDIETENGVLSYVEIIGNNFSINDVGVLLFFDDSYTDYIVIAR